MNKKLVPVIVVLVLLAAGGYYLKTRSATTPPANQTTGQDINEANEFAKAMESGKPTTCTMTKDDDVMEYHIKGKLMAANITTKVEDKTTLSHMINDGSYLYMWSDDSKQGSKMAITTDEETKEIEGKAKEYQQNAPKFEGESDYQSYKDQGYTINCKSEPGSDSVFTPPTTIEFIDPSAMMKTIPAIGEDGKYDMSQIEELQKQYGGTTSPEE